VRNGADEASPEGYSRRMRHLVIMNPAAGRGRRKRDPRSVSDAFLARSLDFEIALTERPGHAREIVAERGPEFDAVVVAGGDGSLHEVVQALDLDRHRLGLLPAGTGNDFAWTVGWPSDLDRGLDRIAAGGERRVDLGTWRIETAEGTRAGRFHNNVGLGFEALVNRASHRVTSVHGPLLYVLALVRTLPRYRSYLLRFAWEGEEYEGPAVLATIQNGKRVGGTFLLAPEARIDDGRLDLVFTGGMSFPRMMALLPRTFRGGHLRSRRVRAVQSPWVEVDAPGGVPVYVDGEFLSADVKRLRLEALPGALHLF
jgi:diacylglycerol kinase (ATP)